MVSSPTVTKMSFLQATDQTVLEIIQTGEASGSLYRVTAQWTSQYLRRQIWFWQAQRLQTWVTDNIQVFKFKYFPNPLFSY